MDEPDLDAHVRGDEAHGRLDVFTDHIQGRTLGFLGEPQVNVLTLNIALDQKFPVGH